MSDAPLPYVEVWAVHFDTPEHPGMFEARLFHNDQPQDQVIISFVLHAITDGFEVKGMIKILPSPGDPPTLIEIWV